MSRTIEAISRHTVPTKAATIRCHRQITANWQNGFESGGHIQRKIRVTIASVPALEAAR